MKAHRILQIAILLVGLIVASAYGAFGQELTIPDAQIQAGATDTLVLSLDNPAGITSASMEIGYDSSRVTVLDVLLGDDAPWTMFFNGLGSDEISVVMAGAEPATGSNFLKLVVSADSLGDTDIILNSLVWNEGSPAASWVNGTVTVFGLYGDVSGDGTLSPFDASLILQHLVGLSEIPTDQLFIADVSGDGTVSALDASLILQHLVGLIECLPVECEL